MRKNIKEKELKKFPNGEAISNWFFDNEIVSIGKLGKTYSVLDFGIELNTLMTKEIQNLINHISSNGGGVLYFPEGTYLSGAVYLKDKVSLYLEEGAVIYGSENIDDFPLTKTRIEGECCEYYPALINVINTSNTYIFGKGEINGNGLPYWKKFWEDQKRNPKSTNKDTHRPRLLFANECNNLTIDGITFKDSPFWTTHYYKCNNLKITNCLFLSPKEPVPAPSTDGIDIDVCENAVIDSCYFEVNDDAIALKGGKGPYADKDDNNGINKNIIIKNCRFGFCHSALTFGSESIHDQNVVFIDSKLNSTSQLVHFKMRGDTPQIYEDVYIDNINGSVIASFLNINPWTQYFDLKGRKDMPISIVRNVAFSNIDIKCGCFFNVLRKDEQYTLSDFKFSNLLIVTKDKGLEYDYIKNIKFENVKITEK